MAVILQRIVGAPRGGRFYPDFSGVARSHNFYPAPPMEAGDGVVAVALGMGRAIVEGGACIRFCPRYPHHILQFSSVEDMLETTQREFWALPLEGGTADGGMREESFDLAAAEADGALAARRLDLLAGERRRLRRPLAPGAAARDLRPDPEAGAVPARRAPLDAHGGGRARDGHAGRDRVRGEPGRARPGAPASSASSRCGRSP